MNRSFEVLHSDFESYEKEVRRKTPYVFAVVTVLVIGAFVLLIHTLEIHSISHMPAIIAIVGLALVLPFLCRDLFLDDLKWHRYATSVVQTVEPKDVRIEYGYSYLMKAQFGHSNSGLNRSCHCLVLSEESESSKKVQKVYTIKHFSEDAMKYIATLPIEENKKGIEAAKKKPRRAKAFIDPTTNDAVLVELDGNRLWVEIVG